MYVTLVSHALAVRDSEIHFAQYDTYSDVSSFLGLFIVSILEVLPE